MTASGLYPGQALGGVICPGLNNISARPSRPSTSAESSSAPVRYGHGHINDTFVVHTQPGEDPCRRFILQRISSAAFKHPEQVMSNIVGVTRYLGGKIAAAGGDPERETMSVWAARDGGSYFTDSEGSAWRCYPFIEGTVCLQRADTPELFAASGYAFGRFQRQLDGYSRRHRSTRPYRTSTTPSTASGSSRPPLRRTPRAAFPRSGPSSTSYISARRTAPSRSTPSLRGELPLRVTHNDTKLNNVLIDRESGRGICVIDLDTVMPGLAINDFGDSIRFGANSNEEDEPDQSKVHFDLGLYEVYTAAFLEGAGGALTDAELAYLPWGAKLMTLECGIRFLTDYLEGDALLPYPAPEAEPRPRPHPVQARAGHGGAVGRHARRRRKAQVNSHLHEKPGPRRAFSRVFPRVGPHSAGFSRRGPAGFVGDGQIYEMLLTMSSPRAIMSTASEHCR